MNSEEIKERQGTIVDVRTPEEYITGSVIGSVNIPLKEIPQSLEVLRSMKSPLVVCCASGIRSFRAHQFLVQQGIDCYDGGSWLDLKY